MSINMFVPFYYKNINGFIKIIDYNIKTQYLIIECNNVTDKIHTSSLLKFKIGSFVGINTKRFKYNVDEIIITKTGKIKILEQLHLKSTNYLAKAYKYECLIDGDINTIFENSLSKGCGCLVCCSQKIIIGVNDMWTTNPELASLLDNPEDGYKYTQMSNNKVNWECKYCGNIIESKTISEVSMQRLSCPKCSDGISYSEKFIYNLFKYLKIDIIHQFNKNNVDWIKDNTRYDFAILNKSCVIEAHGLQHYEEVSFGSESKRCLDDEIRNDEYKKNLALINGIKYYIIIDCRYSDLNWIKNSILNSNLPKLFNFDTDDVDWNYIDELSQNSLVKKVCDLWNSGIHRTKELENIMGCIKKHAIIKYLKIGAKHGWCNYDPSIQNQSSVICLNTLEIFDKIGDVSLKYNISSSLISSACIKNKNKLNNLYHAGRDCVDNKPLYWVYLDDFCENNEYILSEKRYKPTKKVICLNNNKIYNSSKEAAADYNIKKYNHINNCCNGKIDYAGTDTSKNKLKWMYYEKYLEQEDESCQDSLLLCLN